MVLNTGQPTQPKLVQSQMSFNTAKDSSEQNSADEHYLQGRNRNTDIEKRLVELWKRLGQIDRVALPHIHCCSCYWLGAKPCLTL